MSKDQVSTRCDSDDSYMMMSSLQSALVNTVDDDDDDVYDDQAEEATGIQFATEMIVMNFSRSISASSNYHLFIQHSGYDDTLCGWIKKRA